MFNSLPHFQVSSKIAELFVLSLACKTVHAQAMHSTFRQTPDLMLLGPPSPDALSPGVWMEIGHLQVRVVTVTRQYNFHLFLFLESLRRKDDASTHSLNPLIVLSDRYLPNLLH